MKIQCSCGTKYDFEITPEMAQNPIRFVCQNCGLDASDFVNDLIRKEIAEQFPETASPAPAAAPAAAPLRISLAAPPAEAPATASASTYCSRHRNQPVIAKCIICGTPICSQCLDMFGSFCSPLCKNKADLQGIAAPVQGGKKFQDEARFFRKVGLILGAVGAVVALLLGFWTWYAWIGSVPHPCFALRFEDNNRAYAGSARLVGPDQVVFLHGGTLARHNLKTKQPVWSLELITKEQIDALVQTNKDMISQMNQSGYGRVPLPGQLEREAKITLQNELSMVVSGQNIWVVEEGRVKQYDWFSGKVLQEVALPKYHGRPIARQNELLVPGWTDDDARTQFITHISLANGEQRTEEFPDPSKVVVATTTNATKRPGGPASAAAGNKSTDADKLAERARNVNLPGRIALPAVLANEVHQQQIMKELRDPNPVRPVPGKTGKAPVKPSHYVLVPSPNGNMQMGVYLLEEHIVTREAMKAPPGKSVLNGQLTADKTAEVANEILNDMQRDLGGSTISEDQSRYQVTLHRPDSPDTPDWTGEVVGPPQLFPLKTVNVLAAGKTVTVFDKSNKKLWEATLTYSVSAGYSGYSSDEPMFGEGPCVEHGNVLYVIDQAVLSAFDLATGSARWRLPSVGVVGLFFDGQEMLYVNTTSGSPDDIKYARQIDVTKATDEVLLKVDPKTGKTLWRIKPGGFISYVSGKYLYTVQSYDPNPTDEDALSDTLLGLQKPPYLRIARVDPKTGRLLWEKFQDRAPVGIHFKDNFIELVFKREVQVLSYLTF
jgi:hypothetical protein